MNLVVKNITENELINLVDLGVELQPAEERDLCELFTTETLRVSRSFQDFLLMEKITLNGFSGMEALSSLLGEVLPSFDGVPLTWTEFKEFIVGKEEAMAFLDRTDKYFIFTSGYPIYCFILKNTPEATEFETTYKTWCGKVKTVRSDGRLRVHATTCREDHHPQFVGGGDGIYNGQRTRDICDPQLQFKLFPTANLEIVKDCVFKDEVWIRDGFLMYENAPWGARLNVEIVYPTVYPPGHPLEFMNGIVVRRFVKDALIYGTNYQGFGFVTDAPGMMPAGMALRIRITNPALEGISTWKVWGYLKIHRLYTCDIEELLG